MRRSQVLRQKKKKGGKVDEVFGLQETNKAEQMKEDIMSACPRGSSSTAPSSRQSGRCPLCCPFSCPPPHTLGGKDTRKVRDDKEGQRKSRMQLVIYFYFPIPPKK